MPDILQPDRKFHVVNPDHSLPHSVVVAFATDNLTEANEHFGTAVSFSVYGLTQSESPGKWQLITVLEYPEKLPTGNHDKLQSKIENLAIADVVYCMAVGPSAIRKLSQHQIQPVILKAKTNIKNLLSEFLNQVGQNPGSWQARLLNKKTQLIDAESTLESKDSRLKQLLDES